MPYYNLNDYLNEQIVNFVNYLLIDVGLNLSTIKKYRPKVTDFLSWSVDNGTAEPLNKITRDHVKLYLEDCRNWGMGRPRPKEAFTALRRFFHYLKIMKIIKDDPTEGITISGG